MPSELDDSRGTYKKSSQIKFKTSMLTIPNTGTSPFSNNRNNNIIFKSCLLFTDCISEIHDTQVDNAKDTDVVMSMYNLIEYSYIYLKTS